MPLPSIYTTPQESSPEIVPELLFAKGTPDVAEATEVTVEALRLLRLVDDTNLEDARKEILADFTDLNQPGYDGRLHITLPGSVPFNQLLAVAEGAKPEEAPEPYVFHELWTPGTRTESYTEAELNRGPHAPVARLAVFAATEQETIEAQVDVDPLLHYLDTPYGDHTNEKYHDEGGYETTQLDRLEQDTAAFEARYPEHTLHTLNHRDFAMLALMDRIRGVKTVDPTSPEFVLNRGFMRVPDLGRREFSGVGSHVGDVCSDQGRLYFYRSLGGADLDGGLGLSVGLKSDLIA